MSLSISKRGILRLIFLVVFLIAVALLSLLSNTKVHAVIPVANPHYLYIADVDSNYVSVADLSAKSVVKTIRVGEAPSQVFLNPLGTVLYVLGQNGIDIIDTSNNSIITSIRVCAGGNSIVSASSGNKVYASCSKSNDITYIDTSTNTELGTFRAEFNPWGIAFKN